MPLGYPSTPPSHPLSPSSHLSPMMHSSPSTPATPSTPGYTALEGIKRVVKVFPITQDARKRRKMFLGKKVREGGVKGNRENLKGEEREQLGKTGVQLTIKIDVLEEHKVLTITRALRLMSDLEKQDKGRSMLSLHSISSLPVTSTLRSSFVLSHTPVAAVVLDRKTLDRLISSLEKEKVIETVRLSIPRLSGEFKSHCIPFSSFIFV